MSTYGFFARYIRFVARKTDRSDPDVSKMMALLESLADALESGQAELEIRQEDLALGGRALAGVAGFLQKQILPETVAHGHAAAEEQIRWSIDATMEMMTRCMTFAEIGSDDEVLKLTLPPPPKCGQS